MVRKVTQEDWVSASTEKHSGKYSYSLSKYTKGSDLIEITCPIHGNFWQQANSHKRGCGCKECGFESIREARSMTQEDFLSKAKATHGDKYDYRLSVYKGNDVDVEIVCKEHGSFWQQAGHHTYGTGCSKCGNKSNWESQRTSLEDFIQKASTKHNNIYDYSKVSFEALRDVVTIVCKEHGDFYQSGKNHLSGRGCLKCANATRNDWRKHTTESFVAKATSVHKGLYTYNNAQYLGDKVDTKYYLQCTRGFPTESK